MKTCSKCKESKPTTEFSKKGGGLQYICRGCQAEYKNEHYQKNKADYLAKAKRNGKIAKERLRDVLFEYLLTHPCVDCGEDDPIVLEFDHVRGVKEFNISKSYERGYTTNKVMAEIEKCDVRCANCHRRRTVIQLGWSKRGTVV